MDRARWSRLGPLAWFHAHPRACLYLLSLAIHLALAPFFIHDWDGYVFIQTMHDLLGGQTPYETVEAEPPHIYVGDAVPVVNSWYAYPPVPLLLMAPFFALSTLVSAAPWVERVGVKMAFILGDLLLAYVAAELVRTTLAAEGSPKADARARWIEKVLLLSPFLIFISAMWGMFDTWILAFFLGAVLLTLRGRPGLAGVAFALAFLVKPFPGFLGPLLLGFVALRLGWRATPRFLGAGMVTGLAICLPFFLLAPQGFLEEVLFMHAQRPPQGFTLVGAPLAFGWISDVTGIPLPGGLQPETVSQVSFVLLAGVVGLLATRMLDSDRPAQLLHLCLATLLGVLLVSKVVNEQYFVLPLVLGAVLFAMTDLRQHRWIFIAYSIGGVISAVWLGWHFITLLPVDVALRVLPVDPMEAVPAMMALLGWSDQEAYVYPTLIGALALLPACILSLRFVGAELWVTARGLAARLGGRRAAPLAGGALLVVLLLVAPVSAGVLAARAQTSEGPDATSVRTEGPIVGTYYYLWWSNPSHDPDIEYGNWRKGVTQVPEEGYTTITAGKIRSDFRAMKASGIDLAIVSYHAYDKPKMPAVTRLAAETGMSVAPLIELSELYVQDEHRVRDAAGNPLSQHGGMSLRDGTRDAVVNFTSGALDFTAASPAAWRIDGKPVVVYFDSYFMAMDGSGEVRDRMERAALGILANVTNMTPTGATPAALLASFPAARGLAGDGIYDGIWRAAYDEVYRTFWQEVRAQLEARHGPLYFISGEMWDPEQPPSRGVDVALAGQGVQDASYVYAPSFTWVFHRGDTYEQNFARWQRNHAVKSQYDRAAGSPVIVSLAPGYDDRALRQEHGFVIPYVHEGRDTYDLMWEAALAERPDVVLVATWNEFYEGTGIEPTHEHGRRWLDATRLYSERLDAQAEEPDPRPRVLLVTNLRGALRLSGPIDWTRDLSQRLQQAGHTLWGARAEAVDWHGTTLGTVDLGRYDLVVVEPGAALPLDANASGFPARLDAYLRTGGKVLVLGGQTGLFGGLAPPWTEDEMMQGATRLVMEDGVLPLETSDRLRVQVLSPEARVHLWMANATATAPALWSVAHGEGTLAVTAFKPQGVHAPLSDVVTALRAVTRPFLGPA